MDDKIIVDKKTFKALAVDTRISILKLLTEKQHTLTDMSQLLGMSNSTIKEHLDVLMGAGLIKHDKAGRKWKYYRLTYKGKNFIQPREVKVMFVFIASLIGAVGTGAYLFKQLSKVPLAGAKQVLLNEPDVARTVGEYAAEAAPMAPAVQQFPYATLIVLVLFVAVAIFTLGLYLRKPVVIVGGKKNG